LIRGATEARSKAFERVFGEKVKELVFFVGGVVGAEGDPGGNKEG
jgi:hypothetical protein